MSDKVPDSVRFTPSSQNSELSGGSISVGSLGHPEVCHKPCIFLHYGSCPAGSACRYCHDSHNGKRLTRKQRDEMKRLGEADILALVLPHLLSKKLPAQEEVTSLLEKHLMSLPKERSSGKVSLNVHGLNRSLATMKFRQLVDLCECKELSQISESISNLQAIIAAQNPAVFEQIFSL
ncbi:unnamed protein product [Effrenium voratum]|nr:unnamed protein product [Effrenium voratum]